MAHAVGGQLGHEQLDVGELPLGQRVAELLAHRAAGVPRGRGAASESARSVIQTRLPDAVGTAEPSELVTHFRRAATRCAHPVRSRGCRSRNGSRSTSRAARCRSPTSTRCSIPAAAFTKGHVIDYYTRIAPFVLPHLQGRALTLKRYPNGVDAQYFYEKNAPEPPPGLGQHRHDPDPHRRAHDRLRARRRPADAGVAGQPRRPGAAHLAGEGAPTRARRRSSPSTSIPAPPATIVECARVALRLREVFEHLGLEGFPKTSGSKGMQVYVPLNVPTAYARHQALRAGDRAAAGAPPPRARRLRDAQGPARGQGVRRLEPERRAQDDRRRLLAAREGAPDGLDAAALGGGRGGRRSPATRTSSSFTSADVLERVAEHGDLFAPVETLQQELPEL